VWYSQPPPPSAQVFASGTGNRRHPLFFLSGPRRVLRRILGCPDVEEMCEEDLAEVTAANPTPPSHTLSPRLTPRSYLQSPRGAEASSDLELPVRSAAAAATAAANGSVKDSVLRSKGSSSSSSKSAGSGVRAGVEGDSFTEPEDVAAERQRVEVLSDYDSHPIVVRQLNKTYPGLDGQPPKVRGSGHNQVCS